MFRITSRVGRAFAGLAPWKRLALSIGHQFGYGPVLLRAVIQPSHRPDTVSCAISGEEKTLILAYG